MVALPVAQLLLDLPVEQELLPAADVPAVDLPAAPVEVVLAVVPAVVLAVLLVVLVVVPVVEGASHPESSPVEQASLEVKTTSRKPLATVVLVVASPTTAGFSLVCD